MTTHYEKRRSLVKRGRKFGFRKRMKTKDGRKMLSRKRTGNCAKCQRAARTAIKRARFLALMPFVG